MAPEQEVKRDWPPGHRRADFDARRPQSERGQAIIEFAAVAPFLLIFFLLLVDIALFGFSYVSVTNAVREGARCGAVGASDTAIRTRVEDTSGFVDPPGVSVSRSGTSIGDNITVTANVAYKWITPVGAVPGLSGVTNFSKTAIMRMETGAPYNGTCGGS